MLARPLVGVYTSDPKAKVDQHVVLPTVMTVSIRPDLVSDVFNRMNKNRRQAHAVSKFAGHQSSAESWGTGRAVARIPRVPGGGTHRAGQGAFGNMCRGGRMFAPTKTWRRWHRKINKTEKRYALASAIAASAITPLVMARGHKIEQISEIPLVVDNKVIDAIDKSKKALAFFKAINAYSDVEKVIESRHIRAGKGKLRNKRYVQRRGPLVIHSDETPVTVVKAFRNIPGVELCSVTRLNLLQVAPGGHLGRFIVWTKDAFEKLDNIYGTYRRASTQKSGYRLPRSLVTNADLGRIINSEEVQSVLRAKKTNPRAVKKINPLAHPRVMVKLNPASKTTKVSEHDRRRKLVNTKAASLEAQKKGQKPQLDDKAKAKIALVKKQRKARVESRRAFAKSLLAK